MRVVVHPGALEDVNAASEFYEREGSRALAARFVGEFRRITELLIRHPGLGSPRSGGRRGFSMSVFPYTVIYKERGGELHVLVVKHDKRHPGFGGSRR